MLDGNWRSQKVRSRRSNVKLLLDQQHTLDRINTGPGGCLDGGGALPSVVTQPPGLTQIPNEGIPKQEVVERLRRRIESYRRRQNDCMPRFDQSFSGLREQNLQDTIQLKQRFLDTKTKKVSKAKEKKPDNIQNNVHVQQKFLKRCADESYDTNGPPTENYEPPVKLQCTAQQHGTAHQNEGLTKFSVEIVQQLEFTTSAANSQPQQISTNVTVKTHANASVKSEVSSPQTSTAQPPPGTNNPPGGHNPKANMGLDVGCSNLADCVKQEPDNDFVDLDQCAAALEKDAAANGGTGFCAFSDLIGDDTNDEIISSAALKDLISDINCSDYPEFNLIKDFDFDKPIDNNTTNNLKVEDIKDHHQSQTQSQSQNDIKNSQTQNPLLNNQNNFSAPVFDKNNTNNVQVNNPVNNRMPYSNIDFSNTEFNTAAHRLKHMAEQHHKNEMGLNFNPSNRAPNARPPYSDFQFQGDYNAPTSNNTFHKNNTNFQQSDVIKQEMIFQNNDFSNDMKRKANTTPSSIYTKQYSPYGSPGQSASPGFLNSGRGNAPPPPPPPNTGLPFGGGTPPRPPSRPNNNNQVPSGASVHINQAQQMSINQQNHNHIQVSAGQQLHLSADLKGNVSIGAQQGMHFNQQHNAPSQPGPQNPQNSQPGGMNTPTSSMSNNQNHHNHQGNTMTPNINVQSPMGQVRKPVGQAMGGGMPQNTLNNMMMGGNNMNHPGMHLGNHGDTYSMSQSQSINFNQHTIRRATTSSGGKCSTKTFQKTETTAAAFYNESMHNSPLNGPTGSASHMASASAVANTVNPRLVGAQQTLDPQKLQQILRSQHLMQQQQQQCRPPPPEYKVSTGMGQGMQQHPRYASPAPQPIMRRIPHQPIPPSGPMIRSNVYMLQQQQHQQAQQQAQQQQAQQQQMANRIMYNRQQGSMPGMDTIQPNNPEWRHILMSQQQNATYSSTRPTFQQGAYNMNMSGGTMQQMQPLSHQHQHHQQQTQLRAQQANMLSNVPGNMGHQMLGNQNGTPMTPMSSMNMNQGSTMLHMQQQQQHQHQQQALMQQQNNIQMSMSGIHMQQSQSITLSNAQLQQSQPGNGLINSNNSSSSSSSNTNNSSNNNNNTNSNNSLANFNPQATDFNFEFLDNLPGTGDTPQFTDQELLNSFDTDAGFSLDF